MSEGARAPRTRMQRNPVEPTGRTSVRMRNVRLDHVSYATTHDELGDVVQRLGAALGASFLDGGRHPRFGTQNFVLPLAGGTYVEVVAALDHPAADRLPFGRAVRNRADDGGGWLGWVVAVDDIDPIEQRIGRPAIEGSRVRPDGVELRWRQVGVNDLLNDPQLPFFVEWSAENLDHPSASAAPRVAIETLEIAGDRGRLDAWLGAPASELLGEIAVDWVGAGDGTAQGSGLVGVRFSTARGTVRID